MKAITLVVALVSVFTVSAFVSPFNAGRTSTQLNAEKKKFFNSVFGMDLFAPDRDVNTYGARNKKKLELGKIQPGKSYVPAGLTAAEYEKIRLGEKSKKEANYQKNVAKAGKFVDYTEWYKKRGTDLNDAWAKTQSRGHNMVKTKFDWSGQKNDATLWAKVEKK